MFSFDLQLALLSHILSLRMYPLLHGVTVWGKWVPSLSRGIGVETGATSSVELLFRLFFHSNLPRKPDFVF